MFIYWFCILQTCWPHVLPLIVFNSLVFSIYKVMSSVLLLLQPGCLLFLWCLIALARNSNTMWNRCGENRHPCLAADVSGEGIQVLNIKYDSCEFLWMCFTRLRKFLSTLILLSIFIMKGIRFCQSLYLHLLGWSNGFALTLQLWYIMLVDFHVLHQPGIPRVSPAWSWYIILFTCCWIQFGGILLRIFASIFIRAFHLACLVYPPPHTFLWYLCLILGSG